MIKYILLIIVVVISTGCNTASYTVTAKKLKEINLNRYEKYEIEELGISNSLGSNILRYLESLGMKYYYENTSPTSQDYLRLELNTENGLILPPRLIGHSLLPPMFEFTYPKYETLTFIDGRTRKPFFSLKCTRGIFANRTDIYDETDKKTYEYTTDLIMAKLRQELLKHNLISVDSIKNYK